MSGAVRSAPAGHPVRLTKRTSNLFRSRARTTVPGLDVGGLDAVLAVDAEARTADVQGMSHLRAPGGRDAAVRADADGGPAAEDDHRRRCGERARHRVELVPQRPSARGGRELEVLTGAGEVVLARPDGPHADLFRAFPNSYGTFGYALRLRIELEPVRPFVRLRHLRFGEIGRLVDAVARSSPRASTTGSRSSSSTAWSSPRTRPI